MFKIRCLNKPEVDYTILGGKSYSVGRKEGDIILSDDTTISRAHAKIEMEHPMANITNDNFCPVLNVIDLGSKCGTFVNDGIEANIPIGMRETVTLDDCDKFRFGLHWNLFIVEYTPLVATSSNLKQSMELRNAICKLGAHLIDDWKDSSEYLVMDEITLTVKTLCALIAAKYIVTGQFFLQYLNSVENSKRLPTPNQFLPPIGEEELKKDPSLFAPNLNRKDLFKGKTFLFGNQGQIKRLGPAVKFGGGNYKLISESKSFNLTDPNFLIIPPLSNPALLDNDSKKLLELYLSSGKRIVKEEEIGYAVVYSSVNTYCNAIPGSTATSKTVVDSIISSPDKKQEDLSRSSKEVMQDQKQKSDKPKTPLSFPLPETNINTKKVITANSSKIIHSPPNPKPKSSSNSSSISTPSKSLNHQKSSNKMSNATSKIIDKMFTSTADSTPVRLIPGTCMRLEEPPPVMQFDFPIKIKEEPIDDSYKKSEKETTATIRENDEEPQKKKRHIEDGIFSAESKKCKIEIESIDCDISKDYGIEESTIAEGFLEDGLQFEPALKNNGAKKRPNEIILSETEEDFEMDKLKRLKLESDTDTYDYDNEQKEEEEETSYNALIKNPYFTGYAIKVEKDIIYTSLVNKNSQSNSNATKLVSPPRSQEGNNSRFAKNFKKFVKVPFAVGNPQFSSARIPNPFFVSSVNDLNQDNEY